MNDVHDTHNVANSALPISLRNNPRLDQWIRLHADGTIAVWTGKAELGQGILTALAQIAADELDVPFDSIRISSADTSRSPNEGYTYGSQSIEQSGAALRAVGAHARAIVCESAARLWSVEPSQVTTRDGFVLSIDGRKLSYWDTVKDNPSAFQRDVSVAYPQKSARELKIVGKPILRIDLPAKLQGLASYLQDLRPPGMLHGRIVRPPHLAAKLVAVDTETVTRMDGVIAVVRDGDFLGVVAEREEQALRAQAALHAVCRWSGDAVVLPDVDHLAGALKALRSETTTVVDEGSPDGATSLLSLEATYTRPYLSQGSIGPSCAVAVWDGTRMTVWSHTQGAYPLRHDLAIVLDLPQEDVDVVHVPSAGCYGQNGADDVALDAALLARAVPRRPVRVQWMRDEEFAWAPISPAMVMRARASLSSEGRVRSWEYDVWSNAHAMRPGQPGGINLLAAQHLENPYHRSPPLRIPQPAGDGDRNAIPYYSFGHRVIRNHLILDEPVRNGSLRTLGALGNVFAIESFMDELARAAKADPVAFRRAHLSDPRAVAVLDLAAETAGWAATSSRQDGLGRGVAFSRYKNISTYCAVVAEVDVDRETGVVAVRSVVAAVDVGRIINPDGLNNQIEGGIIQGVSFALKERMLYNRTLITSRDWETYPILRFPEVPSVTVVAIDRPEELSLGGGEGSLGPTVAAVTNAVAEASGARIRELPLMCERIRAAVPKP
jgi:nicotinate dehydrogenase subunit B